ncbi:fluoride efflux transporter CrcB [Hydrogenovibrio sp. SC-1]|uniref:fluoride efflux transporter CrcB n=1 Tax=Hydrogenovibrio sp. SC-1 TaxID=2065820 RepID=UPI000C7AEBF2|nr:fluoride efflux transporter CrcB [Hydrogenovibrio sp. SC-1]PLA75016.1 fluoride efflux transporter CrcB [Hydrogenovibrio sp. SC-1]
MQTFHFAQLMAVGVGGFFGAMSRFWLSNQMYVWLGRDFVWGTLTVNALGSFLIGLLTILLIDKVHLTIEWRALLIVGFLGAFTTFSTFAFETVMYFQQGLFEKALVNIAGNVVLCLAMVWLGLWIGRQFVLAPT